MWDHIEQKSNTGFCPWKMANSSKFHCRLRQRLSGSPQSKWAVVQLLVTPPNVEMFTATTAVYPEIDRDLVSRIVLCTGSTECTKYSTENTSARTTSSDSLPVNILPRCPRVEQHTPVNVNRHNAPAVLAVSSCTPEGGGFRTNLNLPNIDEEAVKEAYLQITCFRCILPITY